MLTQTQPMTAAWWMRRLWIAIVLAGAAAIVGVTALATSPVPDDLGTCEYHSWSSETFAPEGPHWICTEKGY